MGIGFMVISGIFTSTTCAFNKDLKLLVPVKISLAILHATTTFNSFVV